MTTILELVEIIKKAPYEIREDMLDPEELAEEVATSAEAMNIISTLLLEVGHNPFEDNTLEALNNYVETHGNKELIREENLYDHIADLINLNRFTRSLPFLVIDLEMAKKDYHEVQFDGASHYVKRFNSFLV